MLCLASILLSRPYVVWVYGMYAVEVGLSLVLAVRVAGSMARRQRELSVKKIPHPRTVISLHIIQGKWIQPSIGKTSHGTK